MSCYGRDLLGSTDGRVGLGVAFIRVHASAMIAKCICVGVRAVTPPSCVSVMPRVAGCRSTGLVFNVYACGTSSMHRCFEAAWMRFALPAGSGTAIRDRRRIPARQGRMTPGNLARGVWNGRGIKLLRGVEATCGAVAAR